MKKFYLIFAAMTTATGCCKDVTVFVLDQEAEFYNPNQKTVNLKKHPICNSPMMAAQMAKTVFVNVYGEKCLKNVLGMLPIWEIRMQSPDLSKKDFSEAWHSLRS